MKLYILQEKLKEGLYVIERVSPKSLTLPVLNTTLISAKKNFLNLSSTDLEIGIKWWALSKIETEGEIAVPFSLLYNFFTLFPNKQVLLQKKDNTLFVECENYKTQIKGISSEDFPIIPSVPQDDFVELEASSFCRGLEQIIDIASPSQTRPEISGVYFYLQKYLIKIVATDSFRLGEKTLFLEKVTTSPSLAEGNLSFILPQKTAREVVNIFGQKEGKIKIYFSPNQILFENQMTETAHPEVQLVSRLIDGEYPAYQEIIPKKCETQAVLNRGEFLNQLKIAALFGGKINEIRLKVDPKKDGIEFFSQNPDLGEHRSFLKGKIKGKPLEISFNHRFLVSGLAILKSQEVSFELSKEEGPAVLKPVGDQTYLYVVMPIKSG
jgi:DNA polymerase-3 subunit beta